MSISSHGSPVYVNIEDITPEQSAAFMHTE